MKFEPPQARNYTWDRGKPGASPGIALTHRGRLLAFLPYQDARTLADQLHDLADHQED